MGTEKAAVEQATTQFHWQDPSLSTVSSRDEKPPACFSVLGVAGSSPGRTEQVGPLFSSNFGPVFSKLLSAENRPFLSSNLGPLCSKPLSFSAENRSSLSSCKRSISKETSIYIFEDLKLWKGRSGKAHCFPCFCFSTHLYFLCLDTLPLKILWASNFFETT